MRWKFVFENSSVYSCCWCCHVRIATIIFGILWLLVQVALVSLFAAVVLRCSIYDECPLPGLLDDEATTNAVGLPDSDWNGLMKKLRNSNEDDKFAAALIVGGSICVTLMLIYGVAKGRPGYMMPFMGLQVFIFCLSSLTVVSYLSDVPYIKRLVAELPPSVVKDYVMSIDSDYLVLLMVLTSVGILVVQAYFMGIVWSCYKYVNQAERSARLGTHLRSYDPDMITSSEDVEVLLPPKYEEVIAMPAGTNPAPPPMYTPNYIPNYTPN